MTVECLAFFSFPHGRFITVVLGLLHHWKLGVDMLSVSFQPNHLNLLCDVLKLWKPHFCFASWCPVKLCQMGIFTRDHRLEEKEETRYFLSASCFGLCHFSLMFSHWKWQCIAAAAVESSLQFFQPSHNQLHWSSTETSMPAEQHPFLRSWGPTGPPPNVNIPPAAHQQLCFAFCISASEPLLQAFKCTNSLHSFCPSGGSYYFWDALKSSYFDSLVLQSLVINIVHQILSFKIADVISDSWQDPDSLWVGEGREVKTATICPIVHRSADHAKPQPDLIKNTASPRHWTVSLLRWLERTSCYRSGRAWEQVPYVAGRVQWVFSGQKGKLAEPIQLFIRHSSFLPEQS